MKTIEKFKVEVERERVISVVCDFCGLDVKNLSNQELTETLKDDYQFDSGGLSAQFKSNIEVEMSNSYPGITEVQIIYLDACAPCFHKEILSKAKTSTIKNLEI